MHGHWRHCVGGTAIWAPRRLAARKG